MKILTAVLVISILGNLAGLFVLYKFQKKKAYLAVLEQRLIQKDETLKQVNKLLPKKMVFLHHSVGRNWLNDGLREELMSRGIAVQSITYGDEIGEETDMNNWVPKFENNIEQIFDFGYNDSETQNDIIMFKSCFPNSDIIGAGDEKGNPYQPEKTLNNYHAVFDSLKTIFSAHPDKQFIYVTSPPLHKLKTNAENAARAREFTKWIKSDFVKRYKDETGLDNFIVFDLFDVLANDQNVLKDNYSDREGDSHPNYLANKTASKSFIKFLEENDL